MTDLEIIRDEICKIQHNIDVLTQTMLNLTNLLEKILKRI